MFFLALSMAFKHSVTSSTFYAPIGSVPIRSIFYISMGFGATIMMLIKESHCIEVSLPHQKVVWSESGTAFPKNNITQACLSNRSYGDLNKHGSFKA
jgi:hypothetical protein